MSSIQQVSLGIICLAAAFIFGSYINQYPSLAPDESSTPDSELLTADSMAIQRPEPMPTMSHRKLPNFDMGEPADSPADESSLPAPSELWGRSSPASQPPSGSDLAIDQELAAPPDFSQLAASFHRRPVDQGEVDQLPAMPSMEPRQSGSLKNLADSFKQPETGDVVAKLDSEQLVATDRTVADPGQQRIAPLEPDMSDSNQFETDLASVQPAGSTVNGERFPSPSQVFQKPSSTSGGKFSNLAETGQVRSRLDLPVAETDVKDTRLPPRPSNDRPLTSVLERQEGTPPSVTPPNAMASPETVSGHRERRARVPFGLTDSARAKLVRLKQTATQKISLETTEFTQHQTNAGETLQSISTRYFGKPDFYLDIYLANRDRLRNPVQVPNGTVLRIPVYRE